MCQAALSCRLRGYYGAVCSPRRKSLFLSATQGAKSALNVLHPLQESAVMIYGIFFPPHVEAVESGNSEQKAAGVEMA